MKMEIIAMAFSFAFGTILIACAWKILNWAWLKPKKLEKFLRQQGFSGNSYTLIYGDMKEMAMMTTQAISRPISLSDDIVPRILPLDHHIISKYGKNSFTWMGPTPSINITDPRLIREIPLSKVIVDGMVMYEDEQWSKVRKIVNPAFHQEKLKDMLSKMRLSCNDMIKKLWNVSAANEESLMFEVDMWPQIQALTADVITRTAFGNRHGDGSKIFEILKEQILLFTEVFHLYHIPGWRQFLVLTDLKFPSSYIDLIINTNSSED